MTRLTEFLAAQSQFNTNLDLSALDSPAIYRWEGGLERMPMYIRSGEYNCGAPNERKWWHNLKFHGDGTCQIRVYNDGAFIAQATLTAQESWDNPRRINLPSGSKGYGLSFELVGQYNLRAVEIGFNTMPRPAP